MAEHRKKSLDHGTSSAIERRRSVEKDSRVPAGPGSGGASGGGGGGGGGASVPPSPAKAPGGANSNVSSGSGKKASPEKEASGSGGGGGGGGGGGSDKRKNEKRSELKRAKSPENTHKSPELKKAPPPQTTPESSRKGLTKNRSSGKLAEGVTVQAGAQRSNKLRAGSASSGMPPPALRPAAVATVSPGAIRNVPGQGDSSRAPFVVKDRPVECDIFNRETLIPFFNDGLYSDLVLVGADGTTHAVHRVVMARGSGWIHRQLLADPSSGPWRLAVPFPDPARVLPQVLRALYTGQIEITHDSATAINNLARHLDMTELTKQVAQYLASTVQRHNCVAMLRNAIDLAADDVAEACLNVVARNFSLLREKDWNWLSYRLFVMLLQAEFFQAESEMAVYELISGYIAAHQHELTREQKRTLMEETRFRFLSLAQLQDVVARTADNPPMDLVLEGALAKLEELERRDGAPMVLVGSKKQLKRRQTHGLQFPFSPENEMRGIVHYLATNGSKEEYSNPHLLGVLTVSASSLERGLMLDLVASEPNELWTRPVPASWFCVDFKNRRVRPTYYSLRHGGLHKTDFLRHWDLLGSNDGQTWTLLRRHTADSSLRAGNFAVSSWEIVNCANAFRMFRVIQTGHNSSRHNFLALSGFEIYGELFNNTTGETNEIT